MFPKCLSCDAEPLVPTNPTPWWCYNPLLSPLPSSPPPTSNCHKRILCSQLAFLLSSTPGSPPASQQVFKQKLSPGFGHVGGGWVLSPQYHKHRLLQCSAKHLVQWWLGSTCLPARCMEKSGLIEWFTDKPTYLLFVSDHNLNMHHKKAYTQYTRFFHKRSIKKKKNFIFFRFSSLHSHTHKSILTWKKKTNFLPISFSKDLKQGSV